MGIKEVIDEVGDRIPEWTNSLIVKIEESGFVANNLSVRLISILIILGVVWAGLTLLPGIKPAIAWGIKIIGFILIVSIAFATFI